MADTAEQTIAAPEVAAASGSEQSPATAAGAAAQAGEGVEVRQAQLSDVSPAVVPTGGGQIDILLNTEVPVSASLGQVRIAVGQLLQMGSGSVITLDRKVGEPVDLILRGIPFARGHLVVVGEQLGVRIEQVLPKNLSE